MSGLIGHDFSIMVKQIAILKSYKSIIVLPPFSEKKLNDVNFPHNYMIKSRKPDQLVNLITPHRKLCLFRTCSLHFSFLMEFCYELFDLSGECIFIQLFKNALPLLKRFCWVCKIDGLHPTCLL